MNDRSPLVDTNILVYAYDTTQGEKHKIANEIIKRLWLEGGTITVQNLQEFFVVVTKKVKNKISTAQAKEIIEGFILSPKWMVLESSVLTFLEGIDIHVRDAIPFWDAQIASVALAAGITKIITEDSDFERLKKLKVINPFSKK